MSRFRRPLLLVGVVLLGMSLLGGSTKADSPRNPAPPRVVVILRDSRTHLPVGGANVILHSSSWGRGGYDDSLIRIPSSARARWERFMQGQMPIYGAASDSDGVVHIAGRIGPLSLVQVVRAGYPNRDTILVTNKARTDTLRMELKPLVAARTWLKAAPREGDGVLLFDAEPSDTAGMILHQ